MIDVLIIGAGQAGLALGQQIAEHGRNPVLVEAADAPGASWRNRWDSLRLFTPAEYCSLPGMRFPAPPGTYPGKDDVADYLDDYAARNGLDVRLQTPVTALQHIDGAFTAFTPGGQLTAKRVAVATGPFQTPFVPPITGQFDPEFPQLHSNNYKDPSSLPGNGAVLVVGAGNSGLQIAEELSHHRPVHVAAGSTPTSVPRKLMGRSIFWWLNLAGVPHWDRDSHLGRRLRARGDVNIGTSTGMLAKQGIPIHGRLTGASGKTASFSDGTTTKVAAVLWASGYKTDHTWIKIPGALDANSLRHDRGITPVRGLYTIGQQWQTSMGSSLLGYMGRDAKNLARIIASR